jgi:hypothetical protein
MAEMNLPEANAPGAVDKTLYLRTRPVPANIAHNCIPPRIMRSDFKGRELYVVNNTGETLKQQTKVFITFTNEDGRDASIEIPSTWVPWCVSDISPAEDWFKRTDFTTNVQNRNLLIVNPNFAEDLLATDLAKMELEKLSKKKLVAPVSYNEPTEKKVDRDADDTLQVRADLAQAIAEKDTPSIQSIINSSFVSVGSALTAYEIDYIRRHVSDPTVVRMLP